MQNTEPHKHAAVIHQYAEGHQIQYKPRFADLWVDITSPNFDSNGDFRVAPEPITLKYKRYITAHPFDDVPFLACLEYSYRESIFPERQTGFIGWIDKDWITSEVQP